MSTNAKRVLTPIGIVLAGLVVAAALTRLAPETETFIPERSLPSVRVTAVESATVQAVVQARGTTSPAREITIVPEVSGRVVWVSDALLPGGAVREGEELIRIEPRDYELAVEQQRGQVRSAELELELEEARQQTAREEWEILGNGGEPSPLVLRESQRAAAEMNLISSRSALARAELELERTVIRAPFNASVVEESIDVGQVVGQQSTIARLIGTDELRVTLSVRVEDLALVRLPDASGTGSSVATRQRLRTGEQIERVGRIVGLVDQLDPQTRRAELVAVIDDPLDGPDGLPLLPGSSVDAEIAGIAMEDVIRVPRASVYDGSTVWVVGPDSTLDRRVLQPIWSDDAYLYLRDGLEAGDDVVTSPLSAPVAGTRVEVIREGT